MFIVRVSPVFAVLAFSCSRSVKRWLNMGRVPCQERVLAAVEAGGGERWWWWRELRSA